MSSPMSVEEPTAALVFVYGTLLRQLPNHKILEELGCHFEGEGWAPGQLFISDFPRYVRGNDGKVFGELYTFENLERALAALDDFEGVSYCRARVRVTVGSDVVEAWTYESRRHEEASTLIETGDFMQFLSPKTGGRCVSRS